MSLTTGPGGEITTPFLQEQAELERQRREAIEAIDRRLHFELAQLRETAAELIRELEETAEWLDGRAAIVEKLGAGGRAKERPNPAATAEAARIRGRAFLLRQLVAKASAQGGA